MAPTPRQKTRGLRGVQEKVSRGQELGGDEKELPTIIQGVPPIELVHRMKPMDVGGRHRRKVV